MPQEAMKMGEGSKVLPDNHTDFILIIRPDGFGIWVALFLCVLVLSLAIYFRRSRRK